MQRIIQLILSLVVAFLGVQFTHGEQANVALDGTAYIVNGELYPANWTIAQMNDGDKRGVFHGDVAGVILDGYAYQLDLGKDFAVSQIKIYPRQDECCAGRLKNFRVSLHGGSTEMGAEVWGTDLFTTGNAPSTNGSVVVVDLPTPQTGRWIEIKALSPVEDYALQMTEVEVYADVPPSEINRAVGTAATANQGLYANGSASTIVNGNRFDYVHGLKH